MNEEPKPLKQADNDVYSEAFESKMEEYFRDKAKVKDHLTRQASIKIEGKWT